MNHEPMMGGDIPALFTAVNAVMKLVGYIHKDGEVSFSGAKYKYAGEAAVLKAVRPHMVANGLFFAPVVSTVLTNQGGCITAQVTYRLCHISGGWMLIQVLGQGADRGDKASNKAMTGAFKYVMRQTLALETGDDPDRDASGKTAQEIEEAEKNRAEQARREALDIDDKGHTLWFRTSGRAWIGAQLGGVQVKMDDVSAWSESLGRPRLSGMEEGRVRNLVGLLITPDSDVRRAFDGWLAKGGAA